MDDVQSRHVVGVDVGGTFTDLVQLDPKTGAIRLSKVASTLDNQAYGVLAALDAADCRLPQVDLIVHGTTTTTNAVLERNFSRTGLITTRGFRDVLELGRRTRPQPYGMTGEFTPVIPRDLRLEVPERMDARGEVVLPLDHAAVAAAGTALIASGCESVVIHFLHAYANPTHELEAAEVLRGLWPNDHITLGHALLSESREFERGVTAAVNAAVQPVLDRYISRLTGALSQKGYAGDLLVMNGNGGMVSSRHVASEAAKTVMSGPASGVMAAAYTGRLAGTPDLITYDMGGTSTDVALIRGAEPSVSNEIEIEYAMPIHVPMVDVRTVGAGGGSIARIDAAGLLRVGPESAGSDPGPICYGRGGTAPTLSDANLLLGRLDAAGLSAVEGGVPIEQIARVFEDQLGAPMGLDATGAAAAVVRMANTVMAGAIRMVSVSLGADPRDYALFAFGGAGPLHAAALARELSIPRVLVPARPGITNALGCVVADLRHDFVRTVNRAIPVLGKALSQVFAEQAAEGDRLIGDQAIDVTELRRLHSVDMQYAGQTHLVRVDVPDPNVDAKELLSRFEAAYFARFRIALEGIPAIVVNANTSVVGARKPVDLTALIAPEGRQAVVSELSRKQVFFDGAWYDTPVYWRDHLPLEAHITGPAIITQMDTTILLGPDDKAKGDHMGNIMLQIAPST
ncbi:MAG: hydantoinase/oxoprolinase family protein [Pseudomonadota bacterium]